MLHDSLLREMTAIEMRQQTQELYKRYDIEEVKRQNQLLQQRQRFTTGGVAMVLGIIVLLVFLSTSNRWRHTLEVKNRQLERERNVVVAQNKQLSIERDRAEAASRAKTAFLQSMTHEIRTPLNAISGFTQVLTMPGIALPEAEQQDYSERIQENTRMLTNILDDLILKVTLSQSEKYISHHIRRNIAHEPLNLVFGTADIRHRNSRRIQAVGIYAYRSGEILLKLGYVFDID